MGHRIRGVLASVATLASSVAGTAFGPILLAVGHAISGSYILVPSRRKPSRDFTRRWGRHSARS